MSIINCDVVIIGGGLVGATLAVGLAQNGFNVAVVDKENPDHLLTPDHDGRTTAVSLGSKKIFEKLGVWETMAPYAQPIWEIRVFEDGSPWTVDYHHKDIGPEPMGYIVQNQFLRQSLYQGLSLPNLKWIAPALVESIDYQDQFALVKVQGGQKIEAKLVVGAEGRSSPTRSKSSISVKTWDYPEQALVAHITHEKPHNGCAWEVFLPEGPLALLPMFDHPETGNPRSGIVWAKSRQHNWDLWSDDDLAAQIENHFPLYGKMTVCSKRWTYPLLALTVDSLIDRRLVLVGDAAHVVHPIAGQGVNLGWRDADALVHHLTNVKSLGLDIGCVTTLEAYQRERKKDHRSVLFMTDGIDRLFRHPSRILRFARNAGFALVNHTPPLKRFLMKKAMGL